MKIEEIKEIKEKEKNSARPPFFPMMMDLNGKEILIVGGGRVASRRAETLLKCGAKIKAISPDFCDDFPENKNIKKIKKNFSVEDIDKNFIFIIAATNKREINKLVHITAKSKKIPVNIADNQDECDFFFPSLISCENFSVSVCSAGVCSTLTRKLSDRLRKIWAVWVNEEREKYAENTI